MLKSELIASLDRENENFSSVTNVDFNLFIKIIFDSITTALSSGEKVEIRGFGNFTTRYTPPKTVRNPKTGDVLNSTGKYTVHFKPGKELRERVNHSKDRS